MCTRSVFDDKQKHHSAQTDSDVLQLARPRGDQKLLKMIKSAESRLEDRAERAKVDERVRNSVERTTTS